jgi:hypothetical protein
MPTPTYTPLANITLGSAAASVTFSSISGLYRDLILVVNYGTTTSGQDLRIRLNGDTATNYNDVTMDGNGSLTSSGGGSGTTKFDIDSYGTPGTVTGSILFSIMDYSVTDKHKSTLTRMDNAAKVTRAIAGRWASTSAVTTVLVYLSGSTFLAGCTFSLYGVAA